MMHDNPGGARVLVVDDDALILELVTTRLSLAGYTVFYARDGREALSRLTEVRPRALVLDISMPRLDGFGVLSKMREMKLLDQTPTLVLTARKQPGDVQRAISLGARDFLTKPFSDIQLISRVARLLKKAPELQKSDELLSLSPGGNSGAAQVRLI